MHWSRLVVHSLVMMDCKSGYTLDSMASMPGLMDCSLERLDCNLAKLVSNLDLSGYMMVTLDYSSVKSDCNSFHHMDLPQCPSFQIQPMVSSANSLDSLGCMMAMLVSNLEKWDCSLVKLGSNLDLSDYSWDLLANSSERSGYTREMLDYMMET